jgi:hypothetical protein
MFIMFLCSYFIWWSIVAIIFYGFKDERARHKQREISKNFLHSLELKVNKKNEELRHQDRVENVFNKIKKEYNEKKS